MEVIRASYSQSALQECCEAVRATRFSVQKKAEHFPKAQEIERLYRLCHKKTDCILFDPDFAYCCIDYRNASYRAKEYSKKELDSMLNRCRLDLQWQLTEIISLMRNGEVDVKF